MPPSLHPHLPARARRYRHRRRSPMVVAHAPIITRPRPAEAARWAQLEEREFGRLAQEADHLFDTSLGF
ncbi:MAG: hypothetical protein WCF99_00335 [Chloroflexales bacterium]